MNIQSKDTSLGHFYVSIAKSILRIGAGIFLFCGLLKSSAVLFVVAELLGILEEIV